MEELPIVFAMRAGFEQVVQCPGAHFASEKYFSSVKKRRRHAFPAELG